MCSAGQKYFNLLDRPVIFNYSQPVEGNMYFKIHF